ncbi:MAG: beta-propeller domain-containing protein [Thermoplasmata archaeon]|nr:MAG: beta-propeller domain-containing protein [Thermoplasmata archaeon]
MKKIIAVYLVTILLVGSILAFGIYSFMNDDSDDAIKDKDNDRDDGDGSLSEEVKERWRAYTGEVESPEIITVDPGIAKATPGEELEKLAELEGLNNFKDTASGTTGGNDTYVGGGGDGTEPAKTTEENELADDADGFSDEETREVEEADLVKVIDNTMYILNSYRGLITIDITDPADAHIEGECSVIGYPKDMYVVDFLAIITVQTNYNFWYKYWALEDTAEDTTSSSSEGTIGTIIYIVNVDDPSDPKIVKIVELEGFPAESRRVGHVIYQATNTYDWYYYEEDTSETIVTSINFGDPDKVGEVGQERFKGSSNQVHASSTAFYVAQPKWEYDDNEWIPWNDYEYYTDVTYLDITDPDGAIEKKDTFRSPGYLEDKYQMDEYDDMFRMVTHFWNGIGESKLYIFDISDPDDIDQMGSLLIDDAGSLMATRFAGERAYTIHLPRAVDPLDVLDLSDPYNPELCDVFEMPGWVTHMEVRDMQIIALGVDDSEGQRNVAVSLFDVSDPYNAEMQDRERLGGDYATSTANWEPKALTIDDTHNLVIVPFNSYSRTDYKSIYGVQLVHFDLDKGELTLKGSAESDYSIDRTRVKDDYVLATSFKTLQVIDIEDQEDPEVVKVIELCVNVNDVVPVGDYYIQVVEDWYDDGIMLRSVSGADDLQAIDTDRLKAYWAQLFETPKGLVLAANIYKDDGTTEGKLYKIQLSSDAKISIKVLKELPEGVTFSSYYDYYYYGYYDEGVGMAIEDDGIGRSAEYMPDYYYSYGSDRFMVMGNALLYYHVGKHPYNNWDYNETAGRYLPTPQEKGEDTLYIFDLENIDSGVVMSSIDVEAYSFIGLTNYQNTLYIHHKFSGVDIWNDSKYYYWNWYYKNYAMEIDCSDLSNPVENADYNVPGKVVGAGDGVVFTISDWADENSYYTLNTLELKDGVAEITSAVKVGTGWVNVVMHEDKAYIVSRDYYYYNYYYYDIDSTEEDEINTTFQVIDLSTPDSPVLEVSAKIDGYIDIVEIKAGHIVLRDTTQSSLIVYDQDSLPTLDFEAMIYIQGGYNSIRVYDDALYIPQGYYGVIEAYL